MQILLRYIATFLGPSLLLMSTSVYAQGSLPPPCDSRIYCHGPLLNTVQMAGLGGPFNDSKYFVDMPMVNSPNTTLKHYFKMVNDTNNNPTKEEIQDFVDKNFLPPDTEFVAWNPEDWSASPNFLKNIVDPDLEEWGAALNELWKELGRTISLEVKNEPEKHSLLYVTHPFIVPGGRFRETYYWDSFWTLEGLLLSEMVTTVQGMLENFFEMVQEFNFVPNGGRVYYTRRSQPPYLTPMVKLYFDHTGDKTFISKYINVLETEFLFWETNRTGPIRDKSGKIHSVAQYKVEAGDPRPESYKEDYRLAENLASDSEKERLYVELKSGAESGWDYSTRWFIKDNSNKGDLKDINVTAIAPVDLNSLLCGNARILSELYAAIGNSAKAAEYEDIANVKNQTMTDIFWDEEDGIWYDLNVHNNQKRKYFYLSNVHPLWTGCFGLEGNQKKTVDKAIKYLKKEKVIDYIGGVPTSLRDSGEQWDFPNAWAPLQDHVIMGLYNSRHLHQDAEPLAFELAEKWVRNNHIGYKERNMMFEKYDVTVQGVAGQGGEYEVVTGFGWSNGVAIKLLNLFGDRLTATTGGTNNNVPSMALVTLLPAIYLMIFNERHF